MARKEYIVCDPDKCVACDQCEISCSLAHHKVFDPMLGRIRTVRIEPIVMLAVGCHMCEDAPCVLSCPRDALSQDVETGVIHVDAVKCDGCSWCVEMCDFGVILLNRDTRVVEICDLCADYDEPQCVKYCCKEALSLSTPEVVSQISRHKVVEKLLHELLGT